MAQRFSIRRATLDDVETLVRMRFDMQVELDEGHHNVHPRDVVESVRDYFVKQLTGFHFAAFFVEDGNRVIGTGGVVVYDVPPGPSNPSGAEAFVMNIYTEPEFRGQGIAQAVLDALIDHAYTEGARRVWLRASERGMRVYEHYGFKAPGHYMEMFLHREES